MSPKSSILVFHPNVLVTTALSRFLGKGGRYDCVVECAGPETITSAIRRHDPEVLVFDFASAGLDLEEAMAVIRHGSDHLEVVAYLPIWAKRQASKAIQLGAACVVSQASPVENLRHAVDAACNDGVYFDEALLDGIAEPRSRDGGGATLSERERLVLEQVALGYSAKEIAQSLRLSPKTVETHRARAATKLGLSSRAAIVKHALDQAWLSPL